MPAQQYFFLLWLHPLLYLLTIDGHGLAGVSLNSSCPPHEPSSGKWNLFGQPGDGYYIKAHIGTPPQDVS